MSAPTLDAELIPLPDGTLLTGPLYGDQQPRFWTAPPRHRVKQDGCRACASGTEYVCGCGDFQSTDLLDWAGQFGYDLDDWQSWWLTEATGTKPDGRWAAFECALICSRQNGKNPIDLSVDLLTDSGWKTMGTVQPGDQVYGSDGQLTQVVACTPVYTDEPCYEVSFTDGSSYVVGRSHLWHVRDTVRKSPWQDGTTESLEKDYALRRPDTGRMAYRYRVRCDAVPDTPQADLPIDPYLLGYWLGDGGKDRASVTAGHADVTWLCQRLYKAGARKSGWVALDAPPEGVPQTDGRSLTVSFRLDAPMRSGFETRCRRLDIWGRKRIPEIYLTASAEQRRALLAGLMDSDGSIAVTNKSPQVEFATSFPELANGFLRLARSLGIRVAQKNGPVVVAGKRYRDRARFLWTPTFNPFDMPRKADLWKAPMSQRHELMSITGIKPVAPIPIRCITVAAPDGIFLLGRHFTPTHNSALEVRELGGLFVLGETMLIHTAHEFKAASEHFRRVRDTVTSYDALSRRVKSVTTSHGDEAIELRPAPTLIFGSNGKHVRKKVGARLRFLARSRGSGRSFSADCVVYDEAMILSDEQVGASMPTMSARANPQMYYTASAGYHDSVQLAAVRRRVLHDDQTLMGAEWSINPHEDTCPRDEIRGRKTNRYVVCGRHDDRDDPRSWAKANPALARRITLDHIRKEQAAMSMVTFDRERLGVGDWPSDEERWEVVTEDQWGKCAMPTPGGATRPVAFAVDVDPDMTCATIAAAWEWSGPVQLIPSDDQMAVMMEVARANGLPLPVQRRMVEKRTVVEIPRGCSREGTDWVVPRLKELKREWKPFAIAMPKNGPAAGLIDDAVLSGLDVTPASSADEAAAFALFVTGVKASPPDVIHLGRDQAPGLWASIASADTRDVGDGGRAWCRRTSEADITPITASTLARWALNKKRRNYNPMNSIG